MTGMHKPLPVTVALGPSRGVALLVVTIAVGTFVVAGTLSPPPALLACGFVALLLWTFETLKRIGRRRGPHAIRFVTVHGNRAMVVTTSERSSHATLCESSFVGTGITTLVYKRRGSFFARSMIILPDMLPAEDFRRLRVLMRYGKSEVPARAPPSQAGTS